MVQEISLFDHIWPHFSSDLDFQSHVIFQKCWKYVCWIICFKPYIRIIILSFTVHEIWLIDPIWPTLSSDLDYQGHVIITQNLKYRCSILCSLKLYSRHQNNDYIIYGSRDMADWPLFDQLCQVSLTSKVTWSSDNLENMFAGFLFL